MLSTAHLADEGAPAAFLQQEAERHVDEAIDGLIVGSWRLLFINDRGAQQERILLLCQHSVLRVNIDFSTAKVRRVTRLPLRDMERVVAGPLSYRGDTSKRVGHFLGGASRASDSGPDKARAVRIVMSDAFVDASDRGGLFRGLLTGRGDRAGLKACTLISRLEQLDAPEPEDGPRSIHSFEAALRTALSEGGRVQVSQEDVLLSVSPCLLYTSPSPRDS